MSDGWMDPWMAVVEHQGRAATVCHSSVTGAGSGIPGDVLTRMGVHPCKPGSQVGPRPGGKLARDETNPKLKDRNVINATQLWSVGEGCPTTLISPLDGWVARGHRRQTNGQLWVPQKTGRMLLAQAVLRAGTGGCRGASVVGLAASPPANRAPARQWVIQPWHRLPRQVPAQGGGCCGRARPVGPKGCLGSSPAAGQSWGLIQTPPAGLRCTLPSFYFPAERWRHPQGGKGVSSPSCACPGEGKSIGKTPLAPESPHPSCQNGFLQGGCRAGGVILLWAGCSDLLRLCPLHQGVLGTRVRRVGGYNSGDPGSCLVGMWGDNWHGSAQHQGVGGTLQGRTWPPSTCCWTRQGQTGARDGSAPPVEQLRAEGTVCPQGQWVCPRQAPKGSPGTPRIGQSPGATSPQVPMARARC